MNKISLLKSNKIKKLDLISYYIDSSNKLLNLKFSINDNYDIVEINGIDLSSLAIEKEVKNLCKDDAVISHIYNNKVSFNCNYIELIINS